MSYQQFLEKKQFDSVSAGFEIADDQICASAVSEKQLKDFQRVIVKWALGMGRAAIFADTGLGKTAMQTTWAHHVERETGLPVLILAPLAVSMQTIKEASGFGVTVEWSESQDDIVSGVYVTNYEKMDKFDLSAFGGVVLDESSILKNHTGATRKRLIDACQSVPYRLSCTATPSPNDFMELGNQCEFLGVMGMQEMLAMFFTLDSTPTSHGQGTSTWRLKGHGRMKFWEWMASWAVVIRKPSDLGFSDDGYILPKLNIIEHVIESDPRDGDLFAMPAQTLAERRKAKRESLDQRCELAAQLVNDSSESWIVWCQLNDEQEKINSLITRERPASVQGSDKQSDKEERLLGFSANQYDVMVTKPKIAGMGMNWQNSHNMVFASVSDSFEQFYQAVRRQYRFGQANEVNVHVITSDTEGAVKMNLERKQRQHDDMSESMVSHMREIMKRTITGAIRDKADYSPQVTMALPHFLCFNS